MTLSPCYRATCDAPDCAAVAHLAAQRTADCRAALTASGWTLIEHRVVRSGAPRLLYVCPEHRDWRPLDVVQRDAGPLLLRDAGRDARRRRAMAWLLHGAGATHEQIGDGMGVGPGRAKELCTGYENRIARRLGESADWVEPWARRLRAAGAIR